MLRKAAIVLAITLASLSAARAGLVLGFAVVAALVALPTHAQAGWCASVTGPDGGFVSCGYASWQQCRAAVNGQGGICYPDPRR